MVPIAFRRFELRKLTESQFYRPLVNRRLLDNQHTKETLLQSRPMNAPDRGNVQTHELPRSSDSSRNGQCFCRPVATLRRRQNEHLRKIKFVKV